MSLVLLFLLKTRNKKIALMFVLFIFAFTNITFISCLLSKTTPLIFGQNRVSNIGVIPEIKFQLVGGGVVCMQSHFHVKPNLGYVGLTCD